MGVTTNSRELDRASRSVYVGPMSKRTNETRNERTGPREDRLKAALKSNIARRKAQATARKDKSDTSDRDESEQ